jgi:hypothetical protein
MSKPDGWEPAPPDPPGIKQGGIRDRALKMVRGRAYRHRVTINQKNVPPHGRD